MASEPFVIVGGGLAGATAAEALRTEGFAGELRLICAEPHHPYIRPPLSKGYLSRAESRDSIFVHPEDWYQEHEVSVTVGDRAMALDPAARSLGLASGESIRYDRLLLATGATPRMLGVDGATASGVHYLRTVEDSESLHDALGGGDKRVVIVGGGWIGLEVAAAARSYGNSVTVVMLEAVPLRAAIGDELGTMFRELHESNGVTFVVSGIRSFTVSEGRVTGVVTDAGTIPADVAIVGVGAIPNTALAEAAGLQIDNGILVNEHLATSAPEVFAAGDVANAFHPVIGRHVRSEHWANAIASGKVAGAAMVGGDARLDDIPYFYTDQYDLGMEFSGYPIPENANIVYRGDRANREFIAFWVADGRVVAGMNVNIWDVNEGVQDLIRSARIVDPVRLGDPSIELAAV